MTKRDETYEYWAMLFGVTCGLLMLGGLLSGCDSSTGPAPATTSSPTAEHRYVRERFRQEGYSDREAKQAADAIIKFNNAQKNR
jgi:hypothetical protein